MNVSVEPGSKILVADDERHVVRLVQVNLERQGHQVRTAFNGREALEMLERDPSAFDAAVLDVDLPFISGREIREWVKSTPEASHIRVILMGVGDQSDDGGPFLTKPFNPLTILA